MWVMSDKMMMIDDMIMMIDDVMSDMMIDDE